MRAATSLAFGVLATALAGCRPADPPADDTAVCGAPSIASALPDALRETSGVAASRAHPGIFWTHNDSGNDPFIFAIDSTGAIRGRVRLDGVTNRDWEDIAAGPCEPGGATCLFVADIGDNNERHPRIAIYRFPEPDPARDTVVSVARLRATYPDGPRDAEALFVTGTGIYIVNKGWSDAIELFRLAPPYRTGTTVMLEKVQRLAPPPTSVSAHVTAAAADPGGRVAIRTYASLRFYQVDGDTLTPIGRAADLVAPHQLQGEGVDFVSPDRLVVTGEAQGPRPASVALLSCDPLRPAPDSASAR